MMLWMDFKKLFYKQFITPEVLRRWELELQAVHRDPAISMSAYLNDIYQIHSKVASAKKLSTKVTDGYDGVSPLERDRIKHFINGIQGEEYLHLMTRVANTDGWNSVVQKALAIESDLK